MISVRVFPEEVTLLLNQVPKEIANALRAKMGDLIEQLRVETFAGGGGKFLSRDQMDSGVETQGSLVIGYLSYTDKDGVYPISPKRYAFLFSKERHFFARQVYAHPYPKGSNWVASLLANKKPWLEEQLSQAAEDAL